MNRNLAALASLLLGLCLAVHPAWADEETENQKPRNVPLTKEQKERYAKRAKEERAKHKAARQVKPVSLNSASLEELKTLPGVGDKEAFQIIGGRPYGSKAWLQSKGVIDPVIYQGIKSLVVVGEPSKEDAAKLPEVFGKKR